jgi:glycosyltransferase involved in cell wall biosynthesis
MISVCIATYNGALYIKEQLNSILPQLSDNDEIIISDDHSTDDTLQIIRSINDKRIKIFINQGEKGYTPNFENALQKALGEYIFLCDQDDIWMENKVSYCINELQSYDFIVSDAVIINSDGQATKDSFYKERIVYKSLIGNIYKFGYLGCCMAFKRNILEKVLPFPHNHQYCTHDNWIFLIAKSFYKSTISNEDTAQTHLQEVLANPLL